MSNIAGINNSGTFIVHNLNSSVITGNHNNRDPQEPNQPGASSTSPTHAGMQTLKEKLTNKLRKLKEAGASNPHEEFCRPEITRFYNETTNPDILADKLYEVGTLTNNDVEKVKSKDIRYDKNKALYGLVISKRALIKLLGALKNSGNEHILELIEELADC